MEPVPRSRIGSVLIAFDALVLAGGRASRLGGFPKPQLVHDGATLLERALEAVQAASRTAVVGPAPGGTGAPAGVLFTLEEPRFGGPVAAIGAGLAALRSPRERLPAWVAVLAADLPLAPAAFAALLAAAEAVPGAGPHTDGVIAVDDDGRTQPLLALYRRGPLERTVAELAAERGLADRPMRHLVARLDLLPLRLPPGLSDDVDTWDAAARWGIGRPGACPEE